MTSIAIMLAQAAPDADASKGAVTYILAALLVGVAAIGAILLIMVVLWGGHTRRITREGLPEVRDPDPFETMRAETRRQTARTGGGDLLSEESSDVDDGFGDGLGGDDDFDGGEDDFKDV